MEIIKIVLTGGPCAGKTTALNTIKKYLLENNIPVITVPETATELILNDHRILGSETVYKFQSLVLRKQLSKEKIAEDYIKDIKKPLGKCVIIFDRGIVDNKAYLNNKNEFKQLLLEQNLTEIEVLDSYDMVLNLLSLATCKVEAYNYCNKARMESIEEAIEVDKKTSQAWIAHRNLKIIDSSISLEEESKVIIKYIKEILSGITTKTIRKFIVDNELSNYNIYDNSNSEKLYITDYFIEGENNNYNYVLSKRQYGVGTSYIYSVYCENNNERNILIDKQISKEEFFELMIGSKLQDKKVREEICFYENRQKYTLCFYEEYTILKVEENILNENIIIPNNLNIVCEINDNKVKRKILNV